ncbi:hypothetical protein H4S02_005194, partial [Coemansia sp. RSA 2611]
MATLHLRKPDPQPADKSPTRKHGLGLRRARTATANSIKKLFKGRRDMQGASSGSSGTTAGSSTGSTASGNNGRRRSLLPGLDSLLPSSSNDSAPVVPAVQNLPIESRPSSAHSTRSVRTMFSSAKRITLRSSMLFKHQNHVGDFGTNAMVLGEYVPTSRIASAPTTATSPAAASAVAAPHSLSSRPQVRHA